MFNFNIGDKVYNPTNSNRLLEVGSVCPEIDAIYPVRVNIGNSDYSESFTEDGKFYAEDANPSLFPATQDWYEKLVKIYPSLEAPPKRREPKEIIKAMLESGWEYVVMIKCGTLQTVHCRTFLRPEWEWESVRPIDPKTGRTIIDFVDGEVILEG